MGVDLTLLPVEPGSQISTSVLQLERRHELFSAIQELDTVPLPTFEHGFSCYLSTRHEGTPQQGIGWGKVTQDDYGSSLTWITPAQLLRLNDHEGVIDNDLNKAVWAFLGVLPEDWRIVLFWH